MRGMRAVALVGAALVAFGSGLPAASAADPKPAAKKKVKKKKRKPAPKTCRAGTLMVKTGSTRRCVALRLAPPPLADADRGQVVLDYALSRAWPAMRDRRGRRVVPLAQRLRKIKGGEAALRGLLARGMQSAAAKRPPLAVRAFAARAAQGGGVAGTFDGTTIGFEGDVPAGEYRIFARYSTNELRDAIDGPDCPTPAGVLDGTRTVTHSIEIRITRDGALVSGVATNWSDEVKYKGQTADDARFDTLEIDHFGRVNTTLRGAGHGPITIRMVAHRRALANMRQHTYSAAPGTLDVSATITGALASLAHELEADLARKLQTDSDRAFASLVVDGMHQFNSVKTTNFNERFDCVRLEYDPNADPRKYLKGERGRFKTRVEPRSNPSLRLNGIYSREAQSEIDVSPASATGTEVDWEFTVKEDDRSTGFVSLKATSKAGTARRTIDIKIEPPSPRWRITSLTYRDELSLDGLLTVGSCTPSTSQTNTGELVPSGAPADGTLEPPRQDGSRSGGLTALGKVTKTTVFHGCQLDGSGINWVPCTLHGSQTADTLGVYVEIAIPAGDGDAKLTWRPNVAPVLGDVPPPGITPCVVFGGNSAALIVRETSVPRARLFDPGPQTISLDAPQSVPDVGGNGTVHSTAHLSLTFHRVNEDGSAYS